MSAPDISPIQEDPEDLSVVDGTAEVYFAAVVDVVPGDTVEWITTGGASTTAACVGARQDGQLRFCRIERATLAQNGTQIAIQVSRAERGIAFQSRFATLSVTSAPVAPTVVSAPVSQTVPAGQDALFEVSAQGTGTLPLFSAARTGPIRYQWLRNGQPIEGARSRQLLLTTLASEAGTTSSISVRVTNVAGSVESDAVDLVIAQASSFVNGDGGSVPGPQGSSLEIPAGALEGATEVAVRAESVPAGLLPPGYIAVGNITVVEPSGASFAVPAQLRLPAPSVIPVGMSLSVFEVLSNGRLSPVSAPIPSTAASGKVGASRRTSEAPSTGVLCVNSQNISSSGRYGTALQRAARILTALIPTSACEATEALKVVLPPPDTQEPCAKDEDFALVNSVANDDKTLVSRHVDCRRSVQLSVNLDVDLIRDPQTGKYSLIPDPTAVQPGDIIETLTYGSVTVEARMSVYGPSRGLSKQVLLDVTLKNFTPNPAYPSPLLAPRFASARIQPELMCIHYESSVNPQCDTVAPPIVAVFGVPATVSFNVPLKWTQRPTNPADPADKSYDVETFRVGFNRFNYALYGTRFERPRAGGAKRFMSSNLGESAKIRCDRGFPKMNGSDGCVFTDAAPVYDMTNRNAPESLGHVREAVRGLNAHWPIFAPGRFVLKPGSRAIAGDSEGLERTTDDPTIAQNRARAVGDSDSLYNVRLPLIQSESCSLGASGCQKDEFPFASTFNGAFFAPDRTSAKLVKGIDNQDSGGPLRQFYPRERVLDFNQYPIVGPRLEGTRFWVFIDEPTNNANAGVRK